MIDNKLTVSIHQKQHSNSTSHQSIHSFHKIPIPISVKRKRRQIKGERGWSLLAAPTTMGIFFRIDSFGTKNPATVGLLLYIAFFQMVLYHSWRGGGGGDNDYSSSLCARSVATHNSRPLVMARVDELSPKIVGASAVGVFPHHKVLPPKNPVQWKPYSRQPIKIPYPVFVTSLPKSGTTSIWKYAQCGGQLAAHNWITKKGATRASLLGQQIEKNICAGRPPFENCGENDVFTDTGVSDKRCI